MTESKYGKYIITELKPDIKLPDFRTDRPGKKTPAGLQHIIWLDKEVVPGSRMFGEFVWFWPGQEDEKNREGNSKTHTHPVDEVIAFLGTNINDPHDLGGEIELWLEGEPHIMDKSFFAWVPAGMKHCPVIIRRIDRPIIHFTMGPGEYK
jgi:hypothetical protein